MTKKEEEEINENFTFYYLNLVLMSFLTNRKKNIDEKLDYFSC